jgi:hypothetical protein
LADVATRFRTFLLADSSIAAVVGQNVHQGFVPEDTPPPVIYFTRTGTRQERYLGESGAQPFSHTFAVEPIGKDLDESQELAGLIRTRCDGYIGTFADTTVKGIFVEDQSDDYEPQYGYHDASLSVEVIPA